MLNLHEAARTGQLNLVPSNILAENLQLRNVEDFSVLDIAASNGHLEQIPAALLTTANMTCFVGSTLNDPDVMISPIQRGIANFLSHFKRNRENTRVLPKQFRKYEHPTKQTPMHYAARHGHLDQLPKEVLTVENMLVDDIDNWTPLHKAAAFGHLDQVPVEILTNPQALFKKRRLEIDDLFTGATVLDTAVEYGNLQQLFGVDLPIECREIVGDEWFNNNQEHIAAVRKAKGTITEEVPKEPEIELF